MKQKKLIFNFFVNRNWKKLTDSRKRAKILADNRKSHHPIETLRHLLYPRFGKYWEEEEWIFKADRKSNIMGKKSQSGPMAPLSLPCFYKQTSMNKCYYYSFKIFPRFWLGKTTRIIHHNQPLNCHIEPMTSKWRHRVSNLLYWTVILNRWPRKPWDENKMAELSGRHCTCFTAKYCLKT